MKLLLPSLPCTLHASRGCRYRDIQQLTNTTCRSSILPPLSSCHTSRRQVRSFRKELIQKQQRWPPLSSGRNLSTSTHTAAVDVKKNTPNTPESGNERKQPGNNSKRDQEGEKDAATLSHQVRLLMRRVPHSVAIITAADRCTPPQGKPIFRGMTVSSFNTVTLDPEPVVSFNVRRPSETLNALQSSGRFLVHLLAPSAATAKLARDFSRGNEYLQLYKDGLGEFEFGVITPWQQQQQTTTTDECDYLPILRRNSRSQGGKDFAQEELVVDFPFIFECKYLPQQAIQVHDHTIVLGSVVRVLEQPQLQRQLTAGDADDDSSSQLPKKKEDNDFCLTYADTRFWKMGEQI
ncbi:hypothetical protein VTN77DRAFT_7015 [Rasamsonia byssochlamydoides]|uniref:uncharacterized protein n=1 Tax=Rasamsonia byssochlamydoides TaxID=89139 RepID=UPI0037431005